MCHFLLAAVISKKKSLIHTRVPLEVTPDLCFHFFFSVILFQRFNRDVSWCGFLEGLTLPWWLRW